MLRLHGGPEAGRAGEAGEGREAGRLAGHTGTLWGHRGWALWWQVTGAPAAMLKWERKREWGQTGLPRPAAAPDPPGPGRELRRNGAKALVGALRPGSWQGGRPPGPLPEAHGSRGLGVQPAHQAKQECQPSVSAPSFPPVPAADPPQPTGLAAPRQAPTEGTPGGTLEAEGHAEGWKGHCSGRVLGAPFTPTLHDWEPGLAMQGTHLARPLGWGQTTAEPCSSGPSPGCKTAPPPGHPEAPGAAIHHTGRSEPPDNGATGQTPALCLSCTPQVPWKAGAQNASSPPSGSPPP